ncbi:glycosyltransferase family 2 protein [Lutimonas halocynthiae]|uniref:glycosyltransferase family 2 protein n=1 Tax=Lutimonas halocynthiae TaxID=1446477 RepID=UPI0025B54B2C|nr:glycosyltransferase family 2 protein [Lutimonas halocynthiae]MDN3644437.1 glycosyltransferase family 2 protein [Lutimonas halocynthiae]
MITAIIPTLNEENFIEEAIRSVSFATEIIVIDSFSQDQTASICKKAKVKLIQREFDDFSSQKNFAIDQAAYNWIFILDADERISAPLALEIKKVANDPQDFVAFGIYRNFYFKNIKVRFGGWQTDKVIRLFRKDKCRYDGKLVHEEVLCSGKVGLLKNRMDHYSFRSQEQYEQKLEFYAALQAKEIKKSGKKVYLIHQLVKPAFRFVVLYLVRFGFLDGKRGYVLAKLHAHAVLNRYLLVRRN